MQKKKTFLKVKFSFSKYNSLTLINIYILRINIQYTCIVLPCLKMKDDKP